MKKVSSIVEAKVNRSAVKVLEDLLTSAKNGEITAIATVALLEDGGVEGDWSSCPAPHKLLGAMEDIKLCYWNTYLKTEVLEYE